jgi:hypothetical protein
LKTAPRCGGKNSAKRDTGAAAVHHPRTPAPPLALDYVAPDMFNARPGRVMVSAERGKVQRLTFPVLLNIFIRMKRRILFLVFGVCAGTFNLHALFEKQMSFGFSGNMLWEEGDFSDGLWGTKDNQSRSMFAPGLYFDAYDFWEDLPIGFFTNSSTYYASVMNYNGKTVDIFILSIQCIAGLVFYFDIGESVRIVTGIGLHLSSLLINAMGSWIEEASSNNNAPDYFMWEYGVGAGIGGEVSINFKITESFAFEIGSAVAYDFNSTHEKYKALYIMPRAGIRLGG